MSLELLNNSGIEFIGDKTCLKNENKTLIVLGIARGGTSLIAGTLDNLGVFTGEKSRSPVFEDVKLSDAFENNDFNLAQNIINQYNNDHKIWGFKRPGSINYLKKMHKMFNNPIYLIVFKDIFSIANRNNISVKLDLLNGLNKAYDDYGKIINFINKNELNAFYFSYEKVMSNKEKFVDLLINIIGKENISEELKNCALDFIEPNSSKYLDASRITKSIGIIGSITKNRIIGWAKLVHTDNPVEVELYINDTLIDTYLAKDFRQNVLDQKIHATGNCGYVFNLNIPLKNGDKISVKVKDDVLFLKNSNSIYNSTSMIEE